MTNKDVNTVSFEIDLKNRRMIGSSDGDSSTKQDIGRKIAKSIARTLDGISDDWLKTFDEKITDEDYEGAYKVFEKNRGLLQFSKDKTVLQKLRNMDISKINRDGGKEYLTFLIAYSSHIGERANSLDDIETLLNQYEEDLDPLLVQNLLLEKANIAAINGLHNKASVLYKNVISSDDSDSGIIAWAYQGLSKIADSDEDIIDFAEKAADKHLESGAKDEAIKNILKISDIKSSNNPEEATKLIDRCIDLYGSEKLIDREFLASLKHKKSNYLHRIGQNKEALPFAEQACNLRRGLIGNEIELHASLSLAKLLADSNGEDDKAEMYKNESNSLSDIIDDENFTLRSEIVETISEGKNIDEELLYRVISSCDNSILSGVLLYQSTNISLPIEESIELLDRARIAIEKQHDKRMLETIYFSIAEKYRLEGMISEAFDYYKKSLSFNQYFHSPVQNCIAMLFNEKRWKDAEDFVKTRLDLVGELPNTCFAYAKALLENKKYSLAFKYFKKSNSNVAGRDEYISECLENIGESEIYSLDYVDETPVKFITAEMFCKSLKEFSTSISSDSRMHFWYRDKTTGKYKWTKNPEELSKQMLITFLNGKFGKGSIEILQEVRAGAGFIDLYVLLSGGLKVVIELKMCGGGYSSTYALSGESQIIHYQNNKATKLGFLVVFDARARDYGKHFKKLQTIGDHTIYSVAVDMRTEVTKKKIYRDRTPHH